MLVANKVLLKKSSVTSKVPLTTDLDYGELALNYADGKLYFKNSSNVIDSFIAGAGGTGGTGTVTSITAGTGLSGGTITTSGTIAIDSTVATLTGSQTLTNKIIAAGSNTISGLTNSNLSGTAAISNANLANSSITINSTSVSLGGTITGLATTAGTLAQFGATTSAELLGVISDETGSGALVFGTAPTMTLPIINNIRQGYSTTVTAAGTTTLTVNSNYYQFFTGTTTQILSLPAPQTMTLGMGFFVVNNSTGNIEVRAANAAVVTTVLPGTSVLCISIDLTAGNGAAGWSTEVVGFSGVTGTGNVVLATSPTLVTPVLGTPASGNFSTGTFTWPTFNQNTTGSAGSVANALTIGSGLTGTSYNGSSAVTITNSAPMVYPAAGIALSTGTAWGTSITNNSADWNTAFGWGNHASAGYLTSGASSSVTIGLTPPVSPTNGALWWDSSSGALKIYYTDVDSAQWVDAFTATSSAGSGGTSSGSSVGFEQNFLLMGA